MNTRNLNKKIKSKIGFGTPPSHRDTESQQISSGPSVSTVSTEVSPSTVLYGDHEGLEHPQILETEKFRRTGNLILEYRKFR